MNGACSGGRRFPAPETPLNAGVCCIVLRWRNLRSTGTVNIQKPESAGWHVTYEGEAVKKRLAAMAIATSLTPALAEVPAWEYGGTVHSIFGGNTLPMGDFFSLNEPVAVAVAIESGQTDTCADAVYGCYSTGIIKARVGDNLLTFASGTLVVSDNYNDLQDTFSVRASTISDLFGTPVNVDFELSGVDFSMTALNSDQMPMNVDAISLFGSRDTKLIF